MNDYMRETLEFLKYGSYGIKGAHETLVEAEISKLLEPIYNGEIIEPLPSKYLHNISLRNKLIKLTGMIIVNRVWLKNLVEFIGARKCLEVMAGKGYLSYALRTQGVDITTTDDYSHLNYKNPDMSKGWHNKWCYVEGLNSVDAIKKYGIKGKIFILNWKEKYVRGIQQFVLKI